MDSPLRAHSGYALRTILKFKLGSDGDLISNILQIKTGFALCPSKGNTDALGKKITTVNFFGDARIEKASPWTSDRISHVPRSLGTINEDLEHYLIPVTTDALLTVVTVAAGTSPITVTPSRNNEANPESSFTSWIVRFSESYNRLSRTLYLFGCRTNTRILPQRKTVRQCSRCWLWHNSRVCVSPQRCRLCGSTQHTESDHANLCSAPARHVCLPKCIPCHGPHPADHEKCKLRS